MTDQCKCRQTLTAALEEAALALGGVAAGYPIPDEAVWELSRAFCLIHERACARFGVVAVATADDADDVEHPAIVHLLRRLHGQPVAGACGGACPGGAVR